MRARAIALLTGVAAMALGPPTAARPFGRVGTLTLTIMATGSTKFIGPDGEVFNNPGQLRFGPLFDHGGTPTDPADDAFLADLGISKPSTGRDDLAEHDLCDIVDDLIG
ncbi:hypothetical protein [Actinokineospora sp. HUAS TT18]|uniref:hypothetical protein n=1 Tax=Actinokineospora sp. HUAS TT18 TaxID=3447451 RepID=UPI003F521322